MIVGRDYLLEKPDGPSAPKLILDTKVIPLAANLAGVMEVGLTRMAARTGVRPALILTGVVGLGSCLLLGLLALKRQSGQASEPFEPRHGQVRLRA